jgi:caa(3)-type oxidase subunit IV
MSGSAEEVRKHIATYKKIAAALAVGTVVTVLASYLDVSVPLGITIALIIATTKASLVANYFMHLGEERSAWLKLTLGLTAAFWLVLMLVPIFTVSDHIGVAKTLPNANAPVEHEAEEH